MKFSLEESRILGAMIERLEERVDELEGAVRSMRPEKAGGSTVKSIKEEGACHTQEK